MIQWIPLHRRSRPHGLTLVETLVVIAIVAILMAIVFAVGSQVFRVVRSWT